MSYMIVQPIPHGIHEQALVYVVPNQHGRGVVFVRVAGKVYTTGRSEMNLSRQWNMNDTIRRAWCRLSGIKFATLREDIRKLREKDKKELEALRDELLEYPTLRHFADKLDAMLRDGGDYVEVPRKPTREMLNAAIDVDRFKLGDISPLGFRCSPQKLFERCYTAMLDAAITGDSR